MRHSRFEKTYTLHSTGQEKCLRCDKIIEASPLKGPPSLNGDDLTRRTVEEGAGRRADNGGGEGNG